MFARVWDDLGRFERVWEGLGGFGMVWEGLGMPKMCSGHQKHVFGRGWEGLGRFERFWKVRESWEGFGRVWECQNCLTVIETSCLGEFGRIWADLELPKVRNCYQIHRQSATQATQGAAKGCQRVPEDDNMDPIWSPNGGGGRAVTTDFFQEICRRI